MSLAARRQRVDANTLPATPAPARAAQSPPSAATPLLSLAERQSHCAMCVKLDDEARELRAAAAALQEQLRGALGVASAAKDALEAAQQGHSARTATLILENEADLARTREECAALRRLQEQRRRQQRWSGSRGGSRGCTTRR